MQEGGGGRPGGTTQSLPSQAIRSDDILPSHVGTPPPADKAPPPPRLVLSPLFSPHALPAAGWRGRCDRPPHARPQRPLPASSSNHRIAAASPAPTPCSTHVRQLASLTDTSRGGHGRWSSAGRITFLSHDAPTATVESAHPQRIRSSTGSIVLPLHSRLPPIYCALGHDGRRCL
ncbi:hypothetical protein K466DRAFT_150031 [Polyporus arcularius HHB13444]|uniref:Uncharacterized protein n=1 Tax=Polyporus arcularius HHB13444 TaxID=1314778 RepID=A0A5C3PB10_9APHY|nr:hypothetical protein K466DRAFT_150031 [Polyporus arcularius HHB13444]